MFAQRGEIVGAIPGYVQRNGWRGAGQPVDDGAVLELLEHIARLAGTGESSEPRAAGAHAPRRQGHAEIRPPGA